MSPRRTQTRISLFSFQDIITSVVGVMLLIVLILLLKLVSQMFAAPPSPTMTEQEIRQQIDSIQPVLMELQDSIVELRRARDQSEVLTPSQEQIDAVRSTIDMIETSVAATDKRIEEIKKRVAELQNDPVMPQLEKVQAEIDHLIDKLAKLTKDKATLEKELQNLKDQNAAQNQQITGRVKVVFKKDTNKTAFIVDYKNVSGRDTIAVYREDGSSERTFSSQVAFFEWMDGRNRNAEHFIVYIRPSRFAQYNRIIEVLRLMKFDVGLQVIGEDTNLFF